MIRRQLTCQVKREGVASGWWKQEIENERDKKRTRELYDKKNHGPQQRMNFDPRNENYAASFQISEIGFTTLQCQIISSVLSHTLASLNMPPDFIAASSSTGPNCLQGPHPEFEEKRCDIKTQLKSVGKNYNILDLISK